MVKIKLSTGAFGSFHERQSGKQMKENKDNNTFKDTSLFKLKVAHVGTRQACTFFLHLFFFLNLVFFLVITVKAQKHFIRKKVNIKININKLYMLKCTNLYERTCIYIKFYFAL